MDELLARLAPTILKRGEFTLSSGVKTDHYFDVKNAYGDPTLFKPLLERLWNLTSKQTNRVVVGQGVGGIPLAVGISLQYGTNLSIIRPDAKPYGTNKRIEGYVPQKDDVVLVFDDVLTSGNSFRSVTNLLATTGARVEQYLVVVNRNPKWKQDTLPARVDHVYLGEEIERATR